MQIDLPQLGTVFVVLFSPDAVQLSFACISMCGITPQFILWWNQEEYGQIENRLTNLLSSKERSCVVCVRIEAGS